MNSPSPSSAEVDKERQFLEGLLKERFNFFIVMAPVYLFGVFAANITHNQKLLALGFGLAVFALFSLALWRTNSLINKALDALTKDDAHPYAFLCKQAGRRPRANTLLFAISVLFVLLTLVLLITTWLGRHPVA